MKLSLSSTLVALATVASAVTPLKPNNVGRPKHSLMSRNVLYRNAMIFPSVLTSNDIMKRQSSSCGSGEVSCENYCMPYDANCCADGSYCYPGYECQRGDNGLIGCCEEGETCTGDGGTIPDLSGPSCDSNEESCEGFCIPLGTQCCLDGGYCPAGDNCQFDNNGDIGCCAIGDSCSGSSSDSDDSSDSSGSSSSSGSSDSGDSSDSDSSSSSSDDYYSTSTSASYSSTASDDYYTSSSSSSSSSSSYSFVFGGDVPTVTLPPFTPSSVAGGGSNSGGNSGSGSPPGMGSGGSKSVSLTAMALVNGIAFSMALLGAGALLL